MFKYLVFGICFLLPLFSLAQNERSVEVTGIATRRLLADRITLNVTVIPGEECVIPSGKNYQKYVKECKESNKQLVASRENILKGILESYGNSIQIIERTEIDYRNSLEYDLMFGKMTDVQDFKKKLEEYKNAFKVGELKAFYTKMDMDIYHQVRLESLQDAKKKAESMAQALGESLGKVLNIYESKPGNMGGWMDFIGAMMMTEGGGSRKTKGESYYFGLTENPDEEGYIICTASSFVRFALK